MGYTRSQVAKMFSVLPGTVGSWTTSGKLHASRNGNRSVYAEDDIAQFQYDYGRIRTSFPPASPCPLIAALTDCLTSLDIISSRWVFVSRPPAAVRIQRQLFDELQSRKAEVERQTFLLTTTRQKILDDDSLSAYPPVFNFGAFAVKFGVSLSTVEDWDKMRIIRGFNPSSLNHLIDRFGQRVYEPEAVAALLNMKSSALWRYIRDGKIRSTVPSDYGVLPLFSEKDLAESGLIVPDPVDAIYSEEYYEAWQKGLSILENASEFFLSLRAFHEDYRRFWKFVS